MRFSTLAAALLVAVASAQPQDAADSSAFTTWTMTRTVKRVVETVTATRNTSLVTSSTVSPPMGTASVGVIPQSNGTSTVLGTGAGPSGSAPTGLPGSGAERVGLEMVGLMAVAGLVGLAGL